MSLQNPVSEEAVRWKTKFLDALEDQEKREKSFRNRINLLRRGLVGVSLAGDGLDPVLDEELNRLRAALRAEDGESGLEPMLERIERSVLRLDAGRDQGTAALRQSIEACIEQLQTAGLSRELRRELRKFSKSIPSLVADQRQQPELIVGFLALLRQAMRELTLLPEGNIQDTGFWRRLFFGGEPAVRNQKPEDVPPAQAAPMVARQEFAGDEIATRSQPIAVNTDTATHELPQPQPATASDGEELAQPGFSFIASHVEPVLLRILEHIHLNEHSAPIAEQVRRTVSAGLNWYDFAAVLEDIAAIVASAIEQERTDFQGFLNEINSSLEQVQQFVRNSQQHAERARNTDSALDTAVREQVDSLHDSVGRAEHIDELKHEVQGQLSAILTAVDNFRTERRQQEDERSAETRRLTERIQDLERESRELQTHLARQRDNAARDVLTELPNRGAYDYSLRELLALPRPVSCRFCLVVADVDLFKLINDSYGHLAGDKVLKILAKEISARIRQSDFVARYGGEEFVIIMQDTGSESALQAMEKLREAVACIPFHFKETQVQITMSFGIAEARSEETADSLFEKADRALYMAKRAGRNRCQVFSDTAASREMPVVSA